MCVFCCYFGHFLQQDAVTNCPGAPPPFPTLPCDTCRTQMEAEMKKKSKGKGFSVLSGRALFDYDATLFAVSMCLVPYCVRLLLCSHTDCAVCAVLQYACCAVLCCAALCLLCCAAVCLLCCVCCAALCLLCCALLCGAVCLPCQGGGNLFGYSLLPLAHRCKPIWRWCRTVDTFLPRR